MATTLVHIGVRATLSPLVNLQIACPQQRSSKPIHTWKPKTLNRPCDILV